MATVRATDQPPDVERILDACERDGAGLDAVLDDLGADRVLALVLDEIAARCDASLVTEVTTVEVELTLGGARPLGALVLDAGSAQAVATADAALARVALPATEIARHLWGPRTGARPTVPHVDVAWAEPFVEALRDVGRAVSAVLATWMSGPPDLARSMSRHVSDKWGAMHWYAPHYERYLAPFADRRVRLLEIGIGGYDDPADGGGSLRVWQDHLRRGLIHGLDITEKTAVAGPRIRVHQGDQNDPERLRELAAAIGPLDIVVDDGSHVSEHVLTSFRTLFPLLRDGGLYIVEDLQTSYWAPFGGAAPGNGVTAMETLKALTDVLNRAEFDAAPSPFAGTVTGMHFHHNLVVVEKGVDREKGPPPFLSALVGLDP